MCGIIGCILKEDKDVAPILFDCVSKLEYRGYDSIGLATFADGKIYIKKDKGQIKDVDNAPCAAVAIVKRVYRFKLKMYRRHFQK